MKKVNISVIIPVYNGEKYIRKCLNSIINQSYRDFEIIVVNDGSSDLTEELCKDFLKYDNFKYYSIKNQGVSNARNYGLKRALGNYIVFIDVDDIVDKKYLEVLFKTIKKSKTDLVICGYEVSNNGNPKSVNPQRGKYSLSGFIDNYILTSFINMPWAKIYKRELISSFFNVSKNMGEDFEFNIDYLSNVNSVFCVDSSLYYYNSDNENSVCHNLVSLEKSIYDNTIVIEKLKHENISKAFMVRRIVDFVLIAYENKKSFTDFKKICSIINSDDKLIKMVRKFNINDYRVCWIIKKKYFLLYLYCLFRKMINK